MACAARSVGSARAPRDLDQPFGRPAGSVSRGRGVAINQIGQVTGPGNLAMFGNPGWDLFGLGDTTHCWWNVEGGQVTITSSSNF